MTFITDKEQIKAGLIIFRRGDVGHDQFYCRVRIQKEDRCKTISLKTSDRHTARDRAMVQDADIRFRVKHDVPVFNRPFLQVAEEYADAQQRRANAGEVSQGRAMNMKNKMGGPLAAYVGSTQIHLVSQDRWSEYPLWRRENGVGRRNGTISDSTIASRAC
jgi:integrase